MTEPLISVVVNTYNRAPSLQNALLGLKGVAYSNFEVVIVNGPSSNSTTEVLNAWGGTAKVVACPSPNLAMSRNVGIGASAGEIIAFIDDDAVPHPMWLNELSQPYRDERVGGVGGFTIDNTGVRYQARKTICDRFGNAHYVSPFFDERPLCIPGAPFFPSLLGTNSSFRKSALEAIGGFDHAFAYFLDETDVCLRIIDVGFEIHYAPRALVFHQFAESELRNSKRIPKTLYPSAVSKSYFVMHHGSRTSLDEAAKQLSGYRDELTKSNAWLTDQREISRIHGVSLDQDVALGIECGSEKALIKGVNRKGDLNSAAPTSPPIIFPRNEGLNIALVSQGFPPHNETGIARWTALMANGLAARGHNVHVLTRVVNTNEPCTRFSGGIWTHYLKPDPELGQTVMAKFDLPPNIAAWAAAVKAEISLIKAGRLDVVSFPIWDAEGAAIVDDEDIGIVMSLHTTYAMMRPYKAEWLARPLYDHFMVSKMLKQEGSLLAKAPVILANSRAIVSDLMSAYDVDFAHKVKFAAHGTSDPFLEKPERRNARMAQRQQFLVTFVGRFEERKGFEVAANVIQRFLDKAPFANAVFVGDVLSSAPRTRLEEIGAGTLLRNPRVRFAGVVPRDELDDLYAVTDAVIMPSRYESFGLVAIEAMAAGAPVIASAVGGLAEVVTDQVTGYLVGIDDREIETAASRLLDISRDTRLRAQLSRSARQEFETRFTIGKMVEQAELAYATAISDKQL